MEKVGGQATGQAYEMAVAKKMQQSTKTGGKQAVALIESALEVSRPPDGTGKTVNIRA